MKFLKSIFPILLTISLFSIWAVFALTVVNAFFYKDLPGYTIGRICIWEGVALLISGLVAFLMIKKWGNIRIETRSEETRISIHPNYGWYFTFYFIAAIIISIWQFYLFSLKF